MRPGTFRAESQERGPGLGQEFPHLRFLFLEMLRRFGHRLQLDQNVFAR